MTGSSGKEDSRQAKQDLGSCSVDSSEGLWGRVSGWCSAVLTARSGLNSCSQSRAGLCTCTQAVSRTLGDQYTCMKCVPLCLCLDAVLLCFLLHLLRAVGVVLSAGDRLGSSSFHTANSGFALCPVRCLCRIIHANGISGGKKEIGLWLHTEMGQGWRPQVEDFPGRRMYQCCFALQYFFGCFLFMTDSILLRKRGRDRFLLVGRCTFKISFKSHNGIGILFSMKTFLF